MAVARHANPLDELGLADDIGNPQANVLVCPVHTDHVPACGPLNGGTVTAVIQDVSLGTVFVGRVNGLPVHDPAAETAVNDPGEKRRLSRNGAMPGIPVKPRLELTPGSAV